MRGYADLWDKILLSRYKFRAAPHPSASLPPSLCREKGSHGAAPMISTITNTEETTI